MFKKILVPFDGSDISATAMPFAAEIARRSGGAITVVRAISEPELVPDIPASVARGLRSVATTETEALVDRWKSEIPVTPLLKQGFATEVILRASRGHDLIVVTTHGRGGISRFVLGSVAEKLIQLSRLPTLVIRPRKGSERTLREAAARMFRDIVVPLDGSERAKDAVAPLAGAATAETRVHLVNVVSRNAADADARKAGDFLAYRAAAMESRELRVVTRLLHHDSPAEAIAAYAENVDAGLIAMASHGRGGWRDWMLGSVTDQVIRRGPVPVLVVRSAKGK